LIKSAMFCCTCLAFAITTGWADAPLTPVKVAAAEAAGPAFNRKDAVKGNSPDGPASDVVMMKSADLKITTGLYKAGPSDIAIDSYSEDEFCYFLSRSVKMTSSDGGVIEVKAGEAGAIPKGWKGTDGRQSGHRIAQHPAIELAR
jgi:ethanolamine utilization protein EutQ